MRKIFITAACALSVAAFSPPVPAGDSPGAIVIRDMGCGLLDGDGAPVFVSSDHAVITPNGKTKLTCQARGLSNSTGRAVHHDFASTGMLCGTDLGFTTQWHETVSASGNATLTCFVR
ncbi:MAG: hypothetical protein OEU54_05460 [Gemmatimonadota bacterium]|nr:hypothetical protein [Gemmatimonadota bacterium]